MCSPSNAAHLPGVTDVVIVGAGPTGLTLACVLASRRIPFVLVDRLAEGVNTSRAAVIHARTLEVLEDIRITDRLRQEGHAVPRFTIRDRDRVLASIRFDTLPTRYPYTLMVPQQITERILVERLEELGGQVVRPCEVRDVRQDAQGVSVVVATPDGASREVRARHVVGADGMHSVVRERAGIGFTGAAYEQSFVLADVRMRWALDPREVTLFFSPEGLVVVAPLPGGRHRVVATLDAAPEHPDIGDVQQLLDTRGPVNEAAHVEEIIWSSRFRVHHRVAERYRNGRILLAGDAAHVHSPAGGQGMNTGIQDAMALGDALAALARSGDESALDAYERTRRPVARRVAAFTDRLTWAATMRSRVRRALRNTMIGAFGRTPLVPWLATELAGLRNR